MTDTTPTSRTHAAETAPEASPEYRERFAALVQAAGLPAGIDPGSRLGRALAVVESLRGVLPAPSLPPIAPRPGESEQQWRDEVAASRAAHNAYAVGFQKAVRAEARDRLGESGDGILSWRLPDAVVLPDAEDIVIDVDAAAIAETAGAFPELAEAARGLDAAAARWRAPVRVQRPAAGGAPAPAIVELHGGAFWMGDGECLRVIGDPAARYLAGRTGAVVLSVDYRLVPEHRYPEPILDALAAVDWVRANAARLGIDPDRIVIAGTSSGGNIATAAALVDASRPCAHPLRGAALTAPALDLADFGTFYSSTPERRTVRSDLMAAYTGDTPPSAPTVSPARHAAPASFPPSVMITSTFDEVAVGSESWAASLEAAGVPVRHGLFPMTHTLGHPADERAMRDFLVAGIEWLISGAAR